MVVILILSKEISDDSKSIFPWVFCLVFAEVQNIMSTEI